MVFAMFFYFLIYFLSFLLYKKAILQHFLNEKSILNTYYLIKIWQKLSKYFLVFFWYFYAILFGYFFSILYNDF